MQKSNYFNEIIGTIKNNKLDKEKLSKLKVKLCKKHKLRKIPTDIEILLNSKIKDISKVKKYLLTKPVRSISGVAPIAVMTKPFLCPHGKCSYCPGGINSVFGNVPQSYTGKEPATRRAIRNKYDAYLQVMNRLEQFIVSGHNPEKIELIVMGGTFPSFPMKYQKEFIKDSFKAMNDFSYLFYKNIFDIVKFKDFFELPGDIENKERTKRIQDKLLKLKNKKLKLETAQKKNETSKIRDVALCIETRPDYCYEKHINEMLRLGTTRVELGVQTVYDRILKKIKRGHSVKDTIKATQLLKDSFLKVGYHMMPGLPDVSREMDLNSLNEMIKNPDFKPDALKIYPCMVMKGTELYKKYKEKKFRPLSTKQAADLIAEFKKNVPEYMRIMRVQRDIPTFMTEEGVDKTNLRQYIEKITKNKKIKCRCIRCREPKNKAIDFENIKIKKYFYEASNGMEVFISAEDAKNDILAGFCRLRKPYRPFRKEITKKSVGIRELHVYGEAIGLGKKGKVQHMGLGRKLLKEAEKISKEKFSAKKILVISGIGARDYYRKFGYKLEGAYMVKKL
ncbi:MAG: tRNA uridine(34) 5-carboxymethylaminomethyl modification radical SAM/GNAT enzyme Elp3 [Candidatus Woesearchaeota archaeon]|jgi:elongator complex protein 3|nr:tRNA uridine(34) 5-carboxymethylaminomethyl modification radical SAM/GNAT enzyme Elp3 [Candidatus Woesearchaeota archaeon]|tara:strand:+ start:22545 stop:24233 length:1689 start_codon:yes stop_codon:yes gene_type:complete